MNFGATGYLLLLVLVAASVAAIAWWAAWREQARARFGRQAPGRLRAYAPAALLLAAVALAVLAAARPQWGRRETKVQESGIDLVVVLDVSRSMQARDVEPDRLGVAQAQIEGMLGQMTGDRAGLVIFAGAPFARSPLTSDLAALAEIVGGVDQESGLVPAGSDLGAAVRRAAQLLQTGGEARSRAMLIVSDGEDHGGGVDAALETARSSGVRVYTAGAGTAAGAQVIDVDPDSGEARPRLDASGAPVLTRLDAAALRAMASNGDGRYVELSTPGELATLAPEFANLAATTFAEEETSQPVERFQIFAAIALALVVAASLTALAPRPSMRAISRTLPLAGAGLLIGALCATDAADWNRRGNDRHERGDYAGALDAYHTAQALAPDAPEIGHNAVNSLNASGQNSSAIDEALRALQHGNGDVAGLIEYALGASYVGSQQLQDALEAYKRSLLENPDDDDARHNLEVVIRMLTPQPQSPTPTPAEMPFTPPVPGSGQGGTPEPQQGQGTPGTTPGVGTPQLGDPNEDLPPAEVQRLLEEALAGIDQDFTTEEALRVLDLIERRNRGELDQPAQGAAGLPDY